MTANFKEIVFKKVFNQPQSTSKHINGWMDGIFEFWEIGETITDPYDYVMIMSRQPDRSIFSFIQSQVLIREL